MKSRLSIYILSAGQALSALFSGSSRGRIGDVDQAIRNSSNSACQERKGKAALVSTGNPWWEDPTAQKEPTAT